MKIAKRNLYLGAGPLITLFLVGLVFVMRAYLPKIPTAAIVSPRSKGSIQAPIQIMEYSDFQCPSCKAAQSTIKALMNEYPDQIRLRYLHFPLEGHKWSLIAHRAAECAASQNRFWEYHDRLYAEQEVWSKSAEMPVEPFLNYAKDVGVGDLNQFAVCLADPKEDQKVIEDQTAGLSFGVRSTPSFFIDGKLVVGGDKLAEAVRKMQRLKRG